jgi:hypothetical protein
VLCAFLKSSTNLRAFSLDGKRRVSRNIGMEAKLCIVLPFGKLLAAMQVGATQAMVKLCSVALS